MKPYSYARCVTMAVVLMSVPASAHARHDKSTNDTTASQQSNGSWMNDSEFWVDPPPGGMKIFRDENNYDVTITPSIPVDGQVWNSINVIVTPDIVGVMTTDCDGISSYTGRIDPHTSIEYHQGVC